MDFEFFAFFKKPAGSLLILLLSFGVLKAQNFSADLRKADSLTHHEKGDAALRLYDHIVLKDSSEKDALVQAALLTIKKGERQKSNQIADSLFNQSKALAEKAMQADPNYAPAPYAMAFSLYTIALRQGVKEKIRGLKETKDYLDRALLLDSGYASAWYLLGRWNMAFHKMNFAERAAVKLLFGGKTHADVTHAITAFLKCKSLKPSFIDNYYQLGMAYHANGEDLKALSTFKEAIHLRPILQEDRKIQEKCQKMVEKLK